MLERLRRDTKVVIVVAPVLSKTDCCGKPVGVRETVWDRVVVCVAVPDLVCVKVGVPDRVVDGVCDCVGEVAWVLVGVAVWVGVES